MGFMSANSTKQTLMRAPLMSAFGGKADISHTSFQCPLMTHSGQFRTGLIVALLSL